MTWDGVAERRGSPRVALEETHVCELTVRARVDLLDVSLTGALVASDTPLPVGAWGELTAVLPSGRFASAVEIQRTHGATQGRTRQFATVFKTMDAQSRAELEAFLHKASD